MAQSDGVKESIVHAFLNSARNQKAFDDIYYRMFSLSASDYCGIPRPAKWAGCGAVFLFFIRSLAKPLVFLWAYFFAYFYITAQILFYYYKSPQLATLPSVQGLALVICDRSLTVLSKEFSSNEDFVWLVPDGVNVASENFGSALSVVASSVLNFQDVIAACFLACKAHHHLVRENGLPFAYQSYVLPSWIISCFAVLSIKPKILATAEHHDRWAVLADFYAGMNFHEAVKTELVVVQHGLEHAETYQMMKVVTNGIGLPYRLKHIKVLYLFDDKQREIFFENIISPSVDSGVVDVRRISISLVLRHVPSEKFRILFVGHPICENFQISLWHSLETVAGLTCFYKPHPVANEGSRVHEQSWALIKDPDFFPEVDLVVSYPSTLVKEYEIFNIPAVIHALDEENSNVLHFVENIIGKIQSSRG